MPVSSLIPYVSIFAVVFGVGVALYDIYKEKQRREEERQRYRRTYKERKVCVSCYEQITNEPGTKKIKCKECKEAYRSGDCFYHEKCSEIGECGKCICCVCEGVMSDWYSTVTRCSLCKGESFRVHKECSDEVIICQGCREKKHLGKCPACPRLRTRHQLKKTRCGKCDLKDLVVHSACVNKNVMCEDCEKDMLRVISKCRACRGDILVRDQQQGGVKCSICKQHNCNIHLKCLDKVRICNDCSRREALGECVMCQRIMRPREDLGKINCSNCYKGVIVHEFCSSMDFSSAMECEECTHNKVIGTCHGCRKDVLSKHQTKNSSCSSCNTESVVHEECYKEAMECVECTDNKVIGKCHVCRKDLLTKHQTMNSLCSICNAPCVVHKGCNKMVMKCMECMDSKTPQKCFLCSTSVMKKGINKAVVNCHKCKKWRQVLHSKCMEINKIEKSTDLTCPKCVSTE